MNNTFYPHARHYPFSLEVMMKGGDVGFDQAYHRGVAEYRARCEEARLQNASEASAKVVFMATCVECLTTTHAEAPSCPQCQASRFQFFLTSEEGELCSPTLRLRRGNIGAGKGRGASGYTTSQTQGKGAGAAPQPRAAGGKGMHYQWQPKPYQNKQTQSYWS